MESTINQHLE
jgi:hypothetical protein